jgi:adenylate kinase
MDKKVIFLIGPPGAGKGTQGKLLSQKNSFYRFITSKEGKEYISQFPDDPDNRKQTENYKAGLLFDPEWLVYRVQKERTETLLKKEDIPGLIYEGSPRTLYEAEHFFKILIDLVGKKNIFVVIIDISEEEIKRRASERLVCDKNEDHFVSTRFSDAKIGDNCPRCDGKLIKRDLDSKTAERIDQYVTRTVPGIEYLKKNHDKVFIIDGNKSIEDVSKDIMGKLNFD